MLRFSCAGAGALSIVEVPVGKVKFAAGAYMGDPQYNPEQMAVFLFYMDVSLQPLTGTASQHCMFWFDNSCSDVSQLQLLLLWRLVCAHSCNHFKHTPF
jgi:hypothetical protein